MRRESGQEGRIGGRVKRRGVVCVKWEGEKERRMGGGGEGRG